MKLTDEIIALAYETLKVPEEKLESPIMIQMMGAPSWGKTFLSEKIRGAVPVVHISGDSLRKKIFPQAEFSEEENRFLFDQVIPYLIKELVREGQSVIIDANTNKKIHRQKNFAFAKELGIRALTLVVKCSDETAKRRIEERRRNPWKLAQRNEYILPTEAYDRIKKEIQFPGWFEKHMTFHSEWREDKKFAKLINYLKK